MLMWQLCFSNKLAESLELDANATIFEICAAIDAQQESLDVAAIIAMSCSKR